MSLNLPMLFRRVPTLELAVDVDEGADEGVVAVALGHAVRDLEGEYGDEQNADRPGKLLAIHGYSG